ncbi:MAG: Mrp/NBP35 family ATP-binding protein [Clostridia bacterium]|nr:Mrp/NBP35 family ATP-binding protein [Clostridia bacterium]MBR3781472.1 Mrp/NBP35 family ATP-binding protein [Clostridia bacterium]MBR3818047.1 Mrp/NBP35 family ATP-binding protein [Clostridia bacterium]
MSECSGNCASCASNCDSRKEAQDMRIPCGPFSNIGKVIGVVSGKGGVGKSLVTSLLATAMQKRGNACAVLDADITGPSIPKSFGISARAKADESGLLPEESKNGTKIMSVNLLLENEESPVVWRGPVISGVIQQFWKDVAWGDVDYMFVDMPPGTGDVSLTVFQNLPVDGIVIVTTPQDLVTMIVKKAYNMAKLMNIPVIGLVENMSGFVCPDCGKEYKIFGESKIDEIAKELGVPVLARIPIDPKTAALVDKGAIELADDKCVADAVEIISKM